VALVKAFSGEPEMTVSQNAPRLAQAFAMLPVLGLIVLASAALADGPKLETEKCAAARVRCARHGYDNCRLAVRIIA
jgi:hypothetical protein